MPKPSRNVLFKVTCPIGNTVELWEKTWEGHSKPRHAEQDHIGDLKKVQATIEDPDQMRLSTHPVVGSDSCLYERTVAGTNALMRIAVIYDSPGFQVGGLQGHVTGIYMPEPGSGGYVGEIFWLAERMKGKKQ
jgi:hypothetical protein